MSAHWPFTFLLYLLPCKEQASADSIVKVNAPEVTSYVGKSGEIHIYVTIKKGFHIQANKVNDDFIIPTTLEINTGEIIATGKQSFPSGKKFRLEGTSDYLLVYDGIFKITIPFKTFEKIQKGKYTLDAKLHYQACDTKTCFSPKTVAFSVAVKII
jgi:Disulphide bond corrector protein DsbC